MDENEFELSGAMYESKATLNEGEFICNGCAFEYDAAKCLQSPDCHGDYRVDARFVIFVEKQQ